jgi:hypothetical protein
VPKLIPQSKIDKIKKLRSFGWSLSEIYKNVKVGYGSVFRYIKGVKIKPQYQRAWLDKRNGSKIRKKKLEKIAATKARKQIVSLSSKEKLIFLAALYWCEGGKTDFNFINSNPEMVRTFINGLKEILKIDGKNIRASIRIYEDLDKNTCLGHWSEMIGIPMNEFVNIDVLKGKKTGKLPYGLCRIRVRKGGNMLKYLLAVNRRVSDIF